MSLGLSDNYMLVGNVDCNIPPYNTGEGFMPIGNSYDPFRGSFDGSNYEITGLFINNSSSNYVGLFGYTESAILGSVDLINVNISGDDAYIGGLIGYQSNGSIHNSHVTGTVTGDTSGPYAFGGLVGYSYAGDISFSYSDAHVTGYTNVGGLVGSLSTDSDIASSYATGDVNGYNYVGGLVGSTNSPSSYITDSYATGTVTGNSGGSYIGGLVGDCHNDIINSYAIGNVTGGSYVGGLLGSNYKSITNSYSTGPVNGMSNVGGLTGYNFGTVNNCYWYDNVGDSVAICHGDGGNTGCTQAASVSDFFASTLDVYDGGASTWDFVGTWQSCPSNYPVLTIMGGMC